MKAETFNEICNVIDRLLIDLANTETMFGKDGVDNLLSCYKTRDIFIKKYAREIKYKLEKEGKPVWKKIENITDKIDNTESWVNMRVWALLAIANNYTEEEAIKRIKRDFDGVPTNFEGELVEDEE